MEYDNSMCKYCKYRSSWDCDGYYPVKGCGNWSLDGDTLTDGQVKRIKKALMLTLDTDLVSDTDLFIV